MSMFNPARNENESFEAYKVRRKENNDRANAIANIGSGHSQATSARRQHRDLMRKNGNMSKHAGHYGKYLRDWITGKNYAAIKFANVAF